MLVTQLFFDTDDDRRFTDRLRAAGIDVPVLPGIIPVTARPGQAAGVAVRREVPEGAPPRARAAPGRPARGRRARRGLRDGPGGRAAERGRARLHLYTLNRSPATRAIVSALRAQGALPAAVAA